MTLKEKTKTYSFWISLVSSLLLICKTIAEQLGYTISDTITTNIITIVCGVMVLISIFIAPTKRKSLKELKSDAEAIMKEQEQTINKIKKEAIDAMDKQERLSIEEQIEFLKAKLEEAEKEPAEEPVQEDVVQEQVVEEIAEEPKIEEPKAQEQHENVQDLGLVELKQLIQELLSRI